MIGKTRLYSITYSYFILILDLHVLLYKVNAHDKMNHSLFNYFSSYFFIPTPKPYVANISHLITTTTDHFLFTCLNHLRLLPLSSCSPRGHSHLVKNILFLSPTSSSILTHPSLYPNFLYFRLLNVQVLNQQTLYLIQHN